MTEVLKSLCLGHSQCKSLGLLLGKVVQNTVETRLCTDCIILEKLEQTHLEAVLGKGPCLLGCLDRHLVIIIHLDGINLLLYHEGLDVLTKLLFTLIERGKVLAGLCEVLLQLNPLRHRSLNISHLLWIKSFLVLCIRVLDSELT